MNSQYIYNLVKFAANFINVKEIRQIYTHTHTYKIAFLGILTIYSDFDTPRFFFSGEIAFFFQYPCDCCSVVGPQQP